MIKFINLTLFGFADEKTLISKIEEYS